MRMQLLLSIIAALAVNSARAEKSVGFCSMYDSCGSKSVFSAQLPCPANIPAVQQTDQHYLETLKKVCGQDFPTTTCCSQSQLDILSSSLAQAEPLIAACPACRSNFRHFYCSFTCSPDQSTFITVTATQEVTKGGEKVQAVKSVDVHVAEKFGKGFYDSCKDIKFGATNGLAMDLLGGGAKTWLAFLRYMGQERALGSPFEINFPASPSLSPAILYDSPGQIPFPRPPNNSSIIPFHDTPLDCSSFDLNARCSCPDCPAVCQPLEPVQSPAEIEANICRVGRMSCFSFSIVIIYGVLLVGSVIALLLQESMKRKKKGGTSFWTRLQSGMKRRGGYDRVPMEDPSAGDDDESPPMVRTRSGGLVGATSTAFALDGESRDRRPPSGSSGINSISPAASQRTGRGSSLLDSAIDPAENPFLQPRTYPLNTILSNFFYQLGYFCASRAYLTLAVGLALCGIINLGWSSFEVERDPVKLWVAKGSESEVAKREFDNAFGPFYRTEQIFISVAPPPGLATTAQATTTANWEPVDEPVLSWNVLQWWASVEEEIRNLKSYPNNYTLKDVCFSPSTSPIAPEDSSLCVVQSLMGYLADSLEEVDEHSWKNTLNFCATSPVNCLPAVQLPLNPKLLFGGVPTLPPKDGEEVIIQASSARAFIVTYVVSNSLDPKVIAKAEEWEWSLQNYLEMLTSATGAATEHGLELAWSTGISLEEELNKSSNTDVPIVVASYLVMFAYISMNLGSSGAGLMKSAGRGIIIMAKGFSQLIQMLPIVPGRSRAGSLSLAGSTSAMGAHFQRQLLVESKFLLGLWGIIIVLLSVSTSVALFSAIGVKVTLIIAEVIPFLVLAIGVDNVFILSHELDRQNSRAHATASRRGPLFIGRDDEEETEVDLPEERVARALARMGPSILLSTCCESVTFALGAMVGMPAVQNFAIYAAGAVLINSILQCTIFISLMYLDLKRVESNRVDCFPCIKLSSGSSDHNAAVAEGDIARFIRTTYAPALLKRPVKYLVLAIFSGLFVLSIIGSRHIELGLDQRLALSADSYLVNYFNALDTYLEVGPPIYFVEKGAKVEERSVQQAICGRFSTCDPLSLGNVLEQERKRPDSSFLAEPPAIWEDDFFLWLSPALEDCCRVKKSDPTIFCKPEDSDYGCKPCLEEEQWNTTMIGFPEGLEFMKYLQVWLESPTNAACPLGGKASYSSALSVKDNKVELSSFRTYHTPLKTQNDFINALAAAQRIAQGLSDRLGVQVFPYSIYAVFFDQYSHIVSTTREVLTLALLSVFLITALFLGSWRTAFVTASVVGSSVVMVMGIMGVVGINLNALSLVNLVISVGISVEFCSHIARAFTGAAGGGVAYNHPLGPKDRNERAFIALVDVGASVFSGITLTKLIGISVLALTKSKLLKVYFFQQWAALIFAGVLHGLVLLPVALSFLGGQGAILETEDFLSESILHRYESNFVPDDELESESEEDSRF